MCIIGTDESAIALGSPPGYAEQEDGVSRFRGMESP